MENLNQIGEQPILTEQNESEAKKAQDEVVNTNKIKGDDILIEPTTTESHEQTGSPYGKFKTAQDLLKAYNNLQAEFTKKCQKLSQLTKPNGEASNGTNENTINKITALNLNENQEDKTSSCTQNNAISSNFALNEMVNSSQVARAENLNNGDLKALSDFILSNPSLRSKVLRDCIEDVQSNGAPRLISTKGTTSLAKPQRAHSVSEAGKLALNMFGTK